MKAKKKKIDQFQADEFGVDLTVSFSARQFVLDSYCESVYCLCLSLFLMHLHCLHYYHSQRIQYWKYLNHLQERKELLLTT